MENNRQVDTIIPTALDTDDLFCDSLTNHLTGNYQKYIDCYVISSRGRHGNENWIKPFDTVSNRPTSTNNIRTRYCATLSQDTVFKLVDNGITLPQDAAAKCQSGSKIFVVDQKATLSLRETEGNAERSERKLKQSTVTSASITLRRPPPRSVKFANRNGEVGRLNKPPAVPPKSIASRKPDDADDSSAKSQVTFKLNEMSSEESRIRANLDDFRGGERKMNPEMNQREIILLPKRKTASSGTKQSVSTFSFSEPAALKLDRMSQSGSTTGSSVDELARSSISSCSSMSDTDVLLNYNISTCSSNTLTYDRSLLGNDDHQYESVDANPSKQVRGEMVTPAALIAVDAASSAPTAAEMSVTSVDVKPPIIDTIHNPCIKNVVVQKYGTGNNDDGLYSEPYESSTVEIIPLELLTGPSGRRSKSPTRPNFSPDDVANITALHGRRSKSPTLFSAHDVSALSGRRSKSPITLSTDDVAKSIPPALAGRRSKSPTNCSAQDVNNATAAVKEKCVSIDNVSQTSSLISVDTFSSAAIAGDTSDGGISSGSSGARQRNVAENSTTVVIAEEYSRPDDLLENHTDSNHGGSTIPRIVLSRPSLEGTTATVLLRTARVQKQQSTDADEYEEIESAAKEESRLSTLSQSSDDVNDSVVEEDKESVPLDASHEILRKNGVVLVVSDTFKTDSLSSSSVTAPAGDNAVFSGEDSVLFADTRLCYGKAGNIFYIPNCYLKRYMDHEGQPWFYPLPLSCLQATAFLQNEQHGCFLVYRKTADDSGSYILSVRCGYDDVVHYNILEGCHGNFVVSGHDHSFMSLNDLVEYFQKNKNGLATQLRRPLKEATLSILSGTHYNSAYDLPRSQITLSGKIIAKGHSGLGLVCAGVYNHQNVAVKVLLQDSQFGDETSENEYNFVEEARILMKLHDNNIIQLIGVSFATKPYFILTELISHGNLRDCIRNGTIPVENIMTLVKCCNQLLSAMVYLESKKYVLHRSLAAKNCLVSVRPFGAETVQIKLSNFERAKEVIDDQYQAESSENVFVKWASPEVLARSEYSTKSDVWATGVVMWEIFSAGVRPFKTLTAEMTIIYVINGGRLSRPTACPERLFSGIQRCWNHSPYRRPSFDKLQVEFKNAARQSGSATSEINCKGQQVSNTTSTMNQTSTQVGITSPISAAGVSIRRSATVKNPPVTRDTVKQRFSFLLPKTVNDTGGRKVESTRTKSADNMPTSSSSEVSLASVNLADGSLADNASSNTSGGTKTTIQKSFRKFISAGRKKSAAKKRTSSSGNCKPID